MSYLKSRYLLMALPVLLSIAGLSHATAGGDARDALSKECAKKAADAEKLGRIAVAGREGWLFFAPELRHLSVGPFWGPRSAKVSRATDVRYADPLPAILDFKRQLDRAKIELIVVPVPPKAVIYPDMLTDAIRVANNPQRLDPYLQQFYSVLRQSGVKVLDLTPEFLAKRSGEHGAVFCKTDSHWSGKACVIAGQRIAALVKSRPRIKGIVKRTFAARWQTIPISGDLLEVGGSNASQRESVAVRAVGAGNEATEIETGRSSPVLLLGDSHTLVFHSGGDMLATGAGLADQLAYELGIPVDLIGVRGSGATPARISLLRQARSSAQYLKGKKVVVWCFGAREFTESSGWQKVPIVP